jgi:hypothetical protein
LEKEMLMQERPRGDEALQQIDIYEQMATTFAQQSKA